jgi:hypothetical protein
MNSPSSNLRRAYTPLPLAPALRTSTSPIIARTVPTSRASRPTLSRTRGALEGRREAIEQLAGVAESRESSDREITSP